MFTRTESDSLRYGFSNIDETVTLESVFTDRVGYAKFKVSLNSGSEFEVDDEDLDDFPPTIPELTPRIVNRDASIICAAEESIPAHTNHTDYITYIYVPNTHDGEHCWIYEDGIVSFTFDMPNSLIELNSDAIYCVDVVNRVDFRLTRVQPLGQATDYTANIFVEFEEDNTLSLATWISGTSTYIQPASTSKIYQTLKSYYDENCIYPDGTPEVEKDRLLKLKLVCQTVNRNTGVVYGERYKDLYIGSQYMVPFLENISPNYESLTGSPWIRLKGVENAQEVNFKNYGYRTGLNSYPLVITRLDETTETTSTYYECDQTVDTVTGRFVYSASGANPSVEKTTTVQFTYLNEYIKPTVDVSVSPPHPETGKSTISVSGNYFNGNFGLVNNDISVLYRYRLIGEMWSNWIASEPINGQESLYYTDSIELDYKELYEYQAIITDKVFSYVTEIIHVETKPVFSWSKNDFEINVDTQINGTLKVKALEYIKDEDEEAEHIIEIEDCAPQLGYIGNSRLDIVFTIPIAESLANYSNCTIQDFNGGFRTNGGYFIYNGIGASEDLDWVVDGIPVTKVSSVTASICKATNQIKAVLTFAAAMKAGSTGGTSVTNNGPLTATIMHMKLILS